MDPHDGRVLQFLGVFGVAKHGVHVVAGSHEFGARDLQGHLLAGRFVFRQVDLAEGTAGQAPQDSITLDPLGQAVAVQLEERPLNDWDMAGKPRAVVVLRRQLARPAAVAQVHRQDLRQQGAALIFGNLHQEGLDQRPSGCGGFPDRFKRVADGVDAQGDAGRQGRVEVRAVRHHLSSSRSTRVHRRRMRLSLRSTVGNEQVIWAAISAFW